MIKKSLLMQQRGILNDESTLMVTDIHEQMMSYKPTDMGAMVLHTEAIHKFNGMADLRRQRIDQVDSHLPGTLWIVLLVGAGLTIQIGYLFWIEVVRFHVLLLSLLTTFIALMIFLIVALDRPFRGEVSVSSASYAIMLERVIKPLDTTVRQRATSTNATAAANPSGHE